MCPEHGLPPGKDADIFPLYNQDFALYLARKYGLPVPSRENMLKYSPFGAVARLASANFLGPESLDDCLKRNINTVFSTSESEEGHRFSKSRN